MTQIIVKLQLTNGSELNNPVPPKVSGYRWCHTAPGSRHRSPHWPPLVLIPVLAAEVVTLFSGFLTLWGTCRTLHGSIFIMDVEEWHRVYVRTEHAVVSLVQFSIRSIRHMTLFQLLKIIYTYKFLKTVTTYLEKFTPPPPASPLSYTNVPWTGSHDISEHSHFI